MLHGGAGPHVLLLKSAPGSRKLVKQIWILKQWLSDINHHEYRDHTTDNHSLSTKELCHPEELGVFSKVSVPSRKFFSGGPMRVSGSASVTESATRLGVGHILRWGGELTPMT